VKFVASMYLNEIWINLWSICNNIVVKMHIGPYLLNYVGRDCSYQELRKNCQTLAVPVRSMLIPFIHWFKLNIAIVPISFCTHPICMPKVKPKMSFCRSRERMRFNLECSIFNINIYHHYNSFVVICHRI
jgi:hypothetical protein